MEYIEPIFQGPLLLSLLLVMCWAAIEWWIKSRRFSSRTAYIIYTEGLERTTRPADFLPMALVCIGVLQGLADQIERGEYLSGTLKAMLMIAIVMILTGISSARGKYSASNFPVNYQIFNSLIAGKSARWHFP